MMVFYGAYLSKLYFGVINFGAMTVIAVIAASRSEPVVGATRRMKRRRERLPASAAAVTARW